MPKPRILVVDATRAVAAEVKRHLEAAEMEVETADSAEAALQRLRNAASQVLICSASTIDAPGLVRRAKEIVPALQAMLLFEPGDDRGNDERVTAAGADGYLVGPVKRGNIVSCVRWSLKVGELAGQICALESEVEKNLHAPGGPDDAAPQADFGFFKRLLLMEVRRARRYHFPLAFLMVGVDHFRQVVEVLEPRDQARMVGRVMAAIVEDIRGIDHCVLFAPDKLLVYLPHTGHEGARIVAERLREKLKEAKGPTLTLSIGLAFYEGEGEVSFGGLLRRASESLKSAQQAGGDRVDDACSPESPEPGPATPKGDDEDFF